MLTVSVSAQSAAGRSIWRWQIGRTTVCVHYFKPYVTNAGVVGTPTGTPTSHQLAAAPPQSVALDKFGVTAIGYLWWALGRAAAGRLG